MPQGDQDTHERARKSGRKGGATSSSRSAAAKKGWETRGHRARG